MAETAARVDMKVRNNTTWNDAFRFGTVGDTSWSFTGKTFAMDVKRDKYDDTALLSLTTGNGRIVVDDAALRILHFLVPDVDFSAILLVGEYVYDLIMIDGSAVRTCLMHGEIKVRQGETED